ncbi:hypothetical protein BP6252_06411 [Coleophoma cylindrospora]|uniref:Uncharacterized protein n=1 Tax=Coleophoma cylindrospora TaxID=1849047 RepID=A0A3D8RMJ3_9HELO|nr:hypothetical protein BP6252_06411 [Coleophoma cylindrospora]
MKFTQSLVILALAANAYAACRIGINSIDPNCCWGGDQGSDACSRQQGGTGCSLGAESGNFCVNLGIPNSKCGHPVPMLTRDILQNADCCDTRTGKGKPCPKGKNRCDPESGCPPGQA